MQLLLHTFSPSSIILRRQILTCSHRSDGLKMLRTAWDVRPTQQELGNFTSSGTLTRSNVKKKYSMARC